MSNNKRKKAVRRSLRQIPVNRTDKGLEATLREAGRAYRRRYLNISEPQDGMVRLDGVLDLEGGATLKMALDALMPAPAEGDDRTAGQRREGALVELARRKRAPVLELRQ